jgi:hypothetical protein
LHARCSFWIISILKVQNWVYTQRTDSRMSSGFGPRFFNFDIRP